MISLKMLSPSSLLSLRSFQPLGNNIRLHLRRISMTAVYQFEHFIDKEFKKAQSNLDIDTLENPKSLLQKLERDQKWRIETTKRARTTRLFRTPNEPRTLTWDTMEQIRYLKQENGDEWTVKKLAYTFDVTDALIIRVLKSKFVPSAKRLKKLDEKARINTGLLPEKTATVTREMGDRKALPSAFPKASAADLTPVVTRPITNAENSKVKPYSRRDLSRHNPQTFPGQRSKGKSTKQEVPKIHQTKKNSGYEMSAKGAPHLAPHGTTVHMESSEDMSIVHQNAISSSAEFREGYTRVAQPRQPNYTHNERNLDPDVAGTVVEEELDIDMENFDSYNDGTPPPRIIRKGNEFFDENGEFLYRV